MKDIVLTGKQIDEFRESLAKAYNLRGLAQMLMIELDKDLENIVERGPGKDIIFDLIRVAQREGWLYRLLKGARAQNTGNFQLLAFEKSIGLAAREYGKSGLLERQLEALIRENDEFIELDEWLTKLNEIEKQVCRVDIDGKPMGTGFLIAPDIVLTNYHVVEKVITAESPNISCRFDFRKIKSFAMNEEGTVYKLAADWLIDHSPYSPEDLKEMPVRLPNNDELDYALLRLSEPLAERGFVQLPQITADFKNNYRENGPLFIVQHPEGEPIKLALDTQSIIRLNDNETRVHYKTYTLGGSSGSPCFNANWELIALHHYGEEYVKNGGIPVTALVAAWERKGIFSEIVKSIEQGKQNSNKPLENNDELINKQEVNFVIKGTFQNFNSASFLGALQKLLEAGEGEIEFVSIAPGSIILSLKISERLAQKIKEMATYAMHKLAALNIIEVKVLGMTIKIEESVQSLSNEDWWKNLRSIATQLYPKGPEENAIWERADGSIAALTITGNGRTDWHNALRVLRQGGGGKNISPKSLVEAMLEDYPNNSELKAL